jgi:hypothetical protein
MVSLRSRGWLANPGNGSRVGFFSAFDDRVQLSVDRTTNPTTQLAGCSTIVVQVADQWV